MNRKRRRFLFVLAAVLGVGACGSSKSGPDGSSDGPLTCSYANGGLPPDGGAFQGVCPANGCPAGTVCVVEIGGVAGGGGESCAPIPNECHGSPSCACMASCVCTNGIGGRAEACSEQNGTIACDNGVR